MNNDSGRVQNEPSDEEPATGDSEGKNDSSTRKIGKFELISILGEGGMGAVYLALDTQTNRKIALKLPKYNKSNREDTVKRFRREAETAASLSHRNICPIHEFGVIDEQLYFSMAYIDGRPLSRFLKAKSSIAPRQIALLIRKLALAVQVAHERGVIHRDLKPDNIMVDHSGEPIVMDFGLARDTKSDDTQLTKTGAFIGTPAYVSPEQITNRRGEVDCRTDIYSLGVVMYRMLAGRLPYEAANSVSMIAQVLAGDPVSPNVHNTAACPRLSEIAMKAMARDKSQRYQSMAELAFDLKGYLRGDTKIRGHDFGLKSSEQSSLESANTNSIDQEEIDFLNINLSDFEESSHQRSAQHLPPRRTSRKNKSKRSGRSTGSIQLTRADNRWSNSYRYFILALATLVLLPISFLIIARPSTTTGLLRVELEGVVDHVTISIDGKSFPIEELQQGLTLKTGPHAVVARSKGFKAQVIDVDIANGEEEVARFTFAPKPPPPIWLDGQLAKVQPKSQSATTSPQPSDNIVTPKEPSAPASERSDIVFADFEDGTYQEWNVEGNFGQKPHSPWKHPDELNSVATSLNGQFFIDTYFDDTGHGTHSYTGKLVSPDFQIERDFINFLMTRGKPGGAYIQLVIDEDVALRADGQNARALVMEPIAWYVGDFMGKTARIEIVDTSQDPNGHVGADLFVFSDADRTPEMQQAVITDILAESIERNGRHYYFGQQKVPFDSAQRFAEMVQGQLLTVESPEEAMFISEQISDPIWLGITKQNETWSDRDGNVYTHGPWLDGLPEAQYNRHIVLRKGGYFDPAWTPTRSFAIEFGETERPLDYAISSPDENRRATELLLSKGASAVVATKDRFFWISPGSSIPDEEFELRKVVFEGSATLSEDELNSFEQIQSIYWLEVHRGNDSLLALLKHTPKLRRLVVRGGHYGWSPLTYLQDEHALRRLDLQEVEINAEQLEPVFRAAALEELGFTGMNLEPRIASLFPDQQHSLKKIKFNVGPGLGALGMAKLRPLKQLQHLQLWGTDFSDNDVRHLAELTDLDWLGFGVNRRVTGVSFHHLKSLEKLEFIRLHGTGLNDLGLSRLPVLPRLKVLHLGKTNITDKGILHLTKFPLLEEIDVSETAVTDRGLEQLLEMDSLRRIDASRTQVTVRTLQKFRDNHPDFSSNVLQ